MPWIVEIFNEAVSAELAALPFDMRSRFQRFVSVIEAGGLGALREPYVKHLEGRLWEMRMSGRDGISRALYVTAHERRVVVVRVFVKKTERTPGRELAIARKRAKEVV